MSVIELQHPLLAQIALTQPKVSLKLTYSIFLAGTEQWAGLSEVGQSERACSAGL